MYIYRVQTLNLFTTVTLNTYEEMNEIESIRKIVKEHWISQVLTPEELETVTQKSTVVNYRKRETVVKKGEFANHLLFLNNGFVKIESDEGDRNFIFDVVEGTRLIGIPVALSFEKYQFSVVTLTDAQVVFIPTEIVKGMLKTNPKLAIAVIEHGNSNFVLPLLDKLRCTSGGSIRGRLAKLIVHLAKDIHKSNKFSLLLNRSELAEMIGFSRENVIRMLTEFSSENLIRLNGKSMTILELAKLEEFAC